ncbi:MAG: HNH endonuclease signature motif containing protein [Planctomycetota bacterium]
MNKLIKEPAILIAITSFNILFLLSSIMMFVIGKIPAGVILSFLFLVGIILVVKGYIENRRELVENVAHDIIYSLKECGLNKFALDDFKTYSSKCLTDACERVYERCAIKALQDNVITDKERQALATLGDRLELTKTQTSLIEKRIKQNKYKSELDVRLADGIITKRENRELQELRRTMGLSEKEALDATGTTVIQGYNALFRRFAQDGILTDEEFIELENYAQATGLSPAEAAKISNKEAKSLYHRTVTMICQDGEITDKEKAILRRLERLLMLSKDDISCFTEEIERTITLSNIRKGNLPRVRTNAMLDSTEICHWQSRCMYRYITPSGDYKDFPGELYVTNERIIFNAPEKAFEFKPRKIIGITVRKKSVELNCSTRVGQGYYFLEESELLGAILETLIRRYSRELLPEGQDKSRHIADSVKVAVWQRDGGKCVKCRANDYLEFDHIIPFSKGGANTEKNIQLLCRRCNLEKGDDLI